MTVTNPIRHEVELVERLWSQGYAAFRTAASGPKALAECDVIAMKNGNVHLFNVEILETGSSTKKVGDKKNDLKKAKMRADCTWYGEEFEVNVGHAIHRLTDDEWYFADTDGYKIRANNLYRTLNEELGE